MDEIAPSLAIEDVVKMTSDAEREKSPEPPTPDQTAIGGRTLAIESVEIDFIGKSSHAGLAPEDGINALDAACAFYQMVNIQKQYYPETNVHGVILETGKKASVIPDFTSLHYLNRAWDMQSIHALKYGYRNPTGFRRWVKVAESGGLCYTCAMGTWESKNRHKYLLQYHIIFVCKYRKKLLMSKQISDDIIGQSILFGRMDILPAV